MPLGGMAGYDRDGWTAVIPCWGFSPIRGKLIALGHGASRRIVLSIGVNIGDIIIIIIDGGDIFGDGMNVVAVGSIVRARQGLHLSLRRRAGSQQAVAGL
jgi:hypothetical protein